MKEQQRSRILILFVLVSGFLAGSALPELFHMGTGTYAGFFSLYGLQKYQEAQVELQPIFAYIFKVRLLPLLFLWMSSFTTAGLLFHLMYIWWLASAAGMLLALFILRNGQNGLLLFGCCLFPQWILYIAMWKQEVLFLLRKQYKWNETSVPDHFLNNDLLNLLKMLLYCGIGAAVETFLGIWTIKIFA